MDMSTAQAAAKRRTAKDAEAYGAGVRSPAAFLDTDPPQLGECLADGSPLAALLQMPWGISLATVPRITRNQHAPLFHGTVGEYIQERRGRTPPLKGRADEPDRKCKEVQALGGV